MLEIGRLALVLLRHKPEREIPRPVPSATPDMELIDENFVEEER